MSTGEIAYLSLVIIGALAFMLTLAWEILAQPLKDTKGIWS